MLRCACRNLPDKFGDKLSKEQLQQIEELGLLADIDDQVCPTDNSSSACVLKARLLLSASLPHAGLLLHAAPPLCC